MRKCFAMMAVVLLAGSAVDSLAKESNVLPNVQAPRDGELLFDLPAANSGGSYLRADTLSFGYVDGDGFAIEGEVWTFDHGGGDPFEGWYATDVTEQSTAYFRHVTAAIWGADPNNLVAAPVLSGTGSAWVGAFGSEANDLCWEAGLGYGNSWCQRLESPVLNYDGSSNVSVNWLHFNDTEDDFDYSLVYLKTLPSGNETLLKRYTGQIGLAGDHPASPPVGETDNDVLNSGDFAGETQYQIVFEMTSDGGWSDEDAFYTTEYGPAGFDNVNIGASSYNFDSGLQAWTPLACPGFGSFFGVNPVGNYLIEDPCSCELDGNVLTLHDGDGEHPYGQRVHARSNPVDVLNDVNIPGAGQLSIFADWDQYSVMPQANGVFYRPGWDYYPFICEFTGEIGWSGRVGQNTFFYVGTDPLCTLNRNIGTAVDVPVPADAEQVRFIFEVYASCDAFGIPPDVCTNVTNFTPIIDNIQIRFTKVPDAPPISFDNGLRYQDGFAQGTQINDPNQPGRADVTRNVNFGNTTPVVLGDSLYVSGPVPTASTRWEAKLWFRVDRVGPGANAAYTTWRDRVADGNDIENGEFTFAFMDSYQLGTQTARNKFVSYFREDDDDFNAGAGELTDGNEIIADNVLFPGTAISYFVTSNYLSSSENYLLPDTTGGFYNEFEILPSWRNDGGTLKYPCLLYVDAYNAGAEFFITNALEVLGLDYDKYDYLDSSSNWKAPMARGAASVSNNGCTLPQLLGYRGILVNSVGSTSMWPEDYLLFSDWLTAEVCDGIATRQGIIFNGDNIATAIRQQGSALLNNQLAAVQLDDSYNDFAGDENYCVRLEAPFIGGEKYGTSNSSNDYEYDAWGNWCPQQYSFDVIGAVGSGVGNRVYLRTDDLVTETEFNQVANEKLVGDNYRTIIDGVSYHRMSEVDAVEECVGDSAHIVTAAFNEIAAALEWVYGVGNIPSLCEDPCGGPGDAPGTLPTVSGVTKMFQNSPNPFNPRTTLRFSLAQTGPAEVSIFDVSGRKVRTLVNGTMEAGTHEVIWDGTDDAGNPLSSGVYWSNLEVGGKKASNMKMVLLK